MTILLLPFAVFEQGDDISAKLGRQIPRMMGSEIEGASSQYGLRTKYLSARGTSAKGDPGFVASTAFPTNSELVGFAEMYGAEAVVAGQIGFLEHEIQLDIRVIETKARISRFSKRFQMFPAYLFDALEEIKLRITQVLGITLTDEERIILFRRMTESWQAYLFYVLAEDDHYGLSVGIYPVDLLAPLKLFREALATDPSFDKARSGLEEYLLEIAQLERTSSSQLHSAMAGFGEHLSPDVRGAISELL